MNVPRRIEPRHLIAAFALVLTGAAFGCGSGAVPGARGTDEVTASGMSKTFAGKGKCDPKNAERPFILEWDATDRSSLEARASSDVIFVKYEGCDLKVIEGCVNDSVKGAFGAYRPVEWTSGALETIDINDTGDLHTKLPLGTATLEGRIEGGEKFHMEYYVSGTRSATREGIYRADLAKIPACKEATHFVYGYNLGAFAIGSQSSMKGNVTGSSAFGFGPGGEVNRAHVAKADKQGGVLASCKGEAAKETATCKVPIRLTLREIKDGESGDAQAAKAPETDAAANLAGKLQASTDREKKAQSFAESAQRKWQARDGASCLADLDQHDQLDPRPQYTSTAGLLASMRAQCLMLSGQCATGKALAKRAWEKMAQMDADNIDRMVQSQAAQYCQGGTMSPKDKILKAKADLERGSNLQATTPAACMAAYAEIKALAPQVKDDGDNQVKMASQFVRANTVGCLARAGDCNQAWVIYQKEPPPFGPPGFKMPDAAMRANYAAEAHNKCQMP